MATLTKMLKATASSTGGFNPAPERSLLLQSSAQGCPILVLEGPAGFSFNLSKYTCQDIYLGSGVFNLVGAKLWNWTRTLALHEQDWTPLFLAKGHSRDNFKKQGIQHTIILLLVRLFPSDQECQENRVVL